MSFEPLDYVRHVLAEVSYFLKASAGVDKPAFLADPAASSIRVGCTRPRAHSPANCQVPIPTPETGISVEPKRRYVIGASLCRGATRSAAGRADVVCHEVAARDGGEGAEARAPGQRRPFPLP